MCTPCSSSKLTSPSHSTENWKNSFPNGWLRRENQNQVRGGKGEGRSIILAASSKHVPCSNLLGEVTEYCYSETNGRRKGHHQKIAFKQSIRWIKRKFLVYWIGIYSSLPLSGSSVNSNMTSLQASNIELSDTFLIITDQTFQGEVNKCLTNQLNGIWLG